MTRPFTARDFACPKCGVRPQEACKLTSGGPRFQSHVERYDVAKDHQTRISLDAPSDSKKTVRAVIEESSEAQTLSGLDWHHPPYPGGTFVAAGNSAFIIGLPKSCAPHPTILMLHDSPDTLEFFRTELHKLERAPEPTMDPIAVADLKHLLIVRIAELETGRGRPEHHGFSQPATNNEEQDDGIIASVTRRRARMNTLTITIEPTQRDVHRLKGI